MNELHTGELFNLDNFEYVIIDELEIDNNEYALLANVDDEEDIIIQKIEEDEENISFLPISSQEEFDKILIAFEKHMTNKVEA